jgi:hypothetical protein
MKIIVALISLLLVMNVYANENYVCEFGAKTRHTKIDDVDPKVEVVKANNKYTLIVDEKGKGTYISVNSSHAVPGPVSVIKNGIRTIFIETNTSDNHFVITVFHSKSTNANKPAIFTLHSWGLESPKEYYPYTATGSCWVNKN